MIHGIQHISSSKRVQNLWLTIKAAERQNAAPLAFEDAYSSYSASKKVRSASAIAKMRGSLRSKGVPDIVQPPLHKGTINQRIHKTNPN